MGRGMTGVDDDIFNYIRQTTLQEPPVLTRLRERTAEMPNAGMQISPEQGQFMALLVRLMGARRCLEVGTFTGYSALAVALALPEDGVVVACDVNDEWTSVGKPFWQDAGVADRIDLRIARGLDTLAALASNGTEPFDFAFIDADKKNYPAYYEKVLDLLRPGGLMLFDNMLWGGSVADSEDTDRATEAIRTVNDRAATDDRVESSLVPLGDGVLLIRKHANTET